MPLTLVWLARSRLHVCNAVTVQVRDVVSERHMGHVRIQFWRDTIDAVYKVSPSDIRLTSYFQETCLYELLSLLLHRVILPSNQ